MCTLCQPGRAEEASPAPLEPATAATTTTTTTTTTEGAPSEKSSVPHTDQAAPADNRSFAKKVQARFERATLPGISRVEQKAVALLDPEAEKSRVGLDYWQPEAPTQRCTACNSRDCDINFWTHCRFCGHIFCQSCAKHKLLHPKTNSPEVCCIQCVRVNQARDRVWFELVSPAVLVLGLATAWSILADIIISAADGLTGQAPLMWTFVTAILGAWRVWAAYEMRTPVGHAHHYLAEFGCSALSQVMHPAPLGCCPLGDSWAWAAGLFWTVGLVPVVTVFSRDAVPGELQVINYYHIWTEFPK